MCKSPILIKNPNYGLKSVCKKNKTSSNINLTLKDVTCRLIPIPCGHCPDCIHLRQSYFVQRTICESFDNDLFFMTLTYNNEHLPSININGYNIHYADIKHVQDMFKRVRIKYNLPSFRYMVVSEFGSTRHRPHFHCLLSFPKTSNQLFDKLSFALELHDIFLKEWSINVGTKKFPKYEPLCTYKITRKSRNFDCHYVNPCLSKGGQSDVAFYVSKYMLKFDKYVDSLKSAIFYNSPDHDTFKELWQKVRPRFLLSKHYGNPNSSTVIKHIRESIDFSLSCGYKYPIFINPLNSTSSPLCPYYRRRFLTLQDCYSFYFMQNSPFDDSMTMSDEDFTPDNWKQKVQKFDKVQRYVLNREDPDIDDFLSDDFIQFTSDYIDVPIEYNKLNINDFNNESIESYNASERG